MSLTLYGEEKNFGSLPGLWYSAIILVWHKNLVPRSRHLHLYVVVIFL